MVYIKMYMILFAGHMEKVLQRRLDGKNAVKSKKKKSRIPSTHFAFSQSADILFSNIKESERTQDKMTDDSQIIRGMIFVNL